MVRAETYTDIGGTVATVKEMTAGDVVQLMRLDARLQGLQMADLVTGKHPELDSIIKSCLVLPDGLSLEDVPASKFLDLIAAFKDLGGNSDFFQMAGLVNVLLGLHDAVKNQQSEALTT